MRCIKNCNFTLLTTKTCIDKMHPFFRLYKLTYSESVKNFQVFETLHDQFQDNNYPSKRMVSVQCTLILKRKFRIKQICLRIFTIATVQIDGFYRTVLYCYITLSLAINFWSLSKHNFSRNSYFQEIWFCEAQAYRKACLYLRVPLQTKCTKIT